MLVPQQDVGGRPFLAGRLSESPELLREVETAQALGISLKRFRGWEPTTRYGYEGGRLVQSQPEAEWDEQEQGWMLALAAHQANQCPGCGGNLNVTTAPEHEDAYRHQPPLQCHRCVGFARSHEAYKDHPHPHSLIHLVPQKPVRTPPSRQ